MYLICRKEHDDVTGTKSSYERSTVNVDDVIERLSYVTRWRHCHVVYCHVVFSVAAKSGEWHGQSNIQLHFLEPGYL